MEYQIREAVMTYLRSDSAVLALLGANPPWDDQNVAPASRYSIALRDKTPLDVCPYVSIAMEADNLVGYNLRDVFLLVRCYNSIDKTFVDIEKVLSRVKVLLHRHRFDLDDADSVSIDTLYESTTGEARDEAYNQNFREARYRLSVL